MTQTLEDLAAARLAEAMDLISNIDDWCQVWTGKDKDGINISPWHKECVQRCALGSVIAACQGREDAVYYLAQNTLETAAQDRTPGWGVIATNDQFPAAKAHREVIALFPPAIEQLRSAAAKRKLEQGIWHPVAVWSSQMQTNYANQYVRVQPYWDSPTGRVHDGQWVWPWPPSPLRWP